MWSPSTKESTINQIWVWSGHSHRNLFLLFKANETTNQNEIWNETSKKLGEHY